MPLPGNKGQDLVLEPSRLQKRLLMLKEMQLVTKESMSEHESAVRRIIRDSHLEFGLELASLVWHRDICPLVTLHDKMLADLMQATWKTYVALVDFADRKLCVGTNTDTNTDADADADAAAVVEIDGATVMTAVSNWVGNHLRHLVLAAMDTNFSTNNNNNTNNTTRRMTGRDLQSAGRELGDLQSAGRMTGGGLQSAGYMMRETEVLEMALEDLSPEMLGAALNVAKSHVVLLTTDLKKQHESLGKTAHQLQQVLRHGNSLCNNLDDVRMDACKEMLVAMTRYASEFAEARLFLSCLGIEYENDIPPLLVAYWQAVDLDTGIVFSLSEDDSDRIEHAVDHEVVSVTINRQQYDVKVDSRDMIKLLPSLLLVRKAGPVKKVLDPINTAIPIRTSLPFSYMSTSSLSTSCCKVPTTAIAACKDRSKSRFFDYYDDDDEEEEEEEAEKDVACGIKGVQKLVDLEHLPIPDLDANLETGRRHSDSNSDSDANLGTRRSDRDEMTTIEQDTETCVICGNDCEHVLSVVLPCGHVFHSTCIRSRLTNDPEHSQCRLVCQDCGKLYGTAESMQPDRGMYTQWVLPDKCIAGFPDSKGYVVLLVSFPAGCFKGVRYDKAAFQYVVPNVKRGYELLRLVCEALQQRLLFEVFVESGNQDDDARVKRGTVRWVPGIPFCRRFSSDNAIALEQDLAYFGRIVAKKDRCIGEDKEEKGLW
jgi:hypothetical protein